MATAPASTRQRRKRRSPEEIMERLVGAASEEFRSSGYRGATTAAIARRADVTEAQLFRYFDSKAELFREAVFRPLRDDLESFNRQYNVAVDSKQDAQQAARRYIAELQAFIAARADLFMVLIVAEAYAPAGTPGVGAVDSLRDYFEHNAATMSERMGGSARLDPALLVRVSFAAVLANVLFRDWLFPGGASDEQQLRDTVIEFVMDGLNGNTPAAAPN